MRSDRRAADIYPDISGRRAVFVTSLQYSTRKMTWEAASVGPCISNCCTGCHTVAQETVLKHHVPCPANKALKSAQAWRRAWCRRLWWRLWSSSRSGSSCRHALPPLSCP